MIFSRKKPTEPAPDFTPGAGIVLHQVTVQVPSSNPQTDYTILDSISATLNAPKTAILGLNGSGKSTVLRLLNGLKTPVSGTVHVGGINVNDFPQQVRNHVGLLFSNPQNQLIMPTPLEDVELSLRSRVKDRKERTTRAQEILATAKVGHRATSSIYDLSGGEQQLAAIASVLAVEPSVLLLDEPTTLLDLRNKLRLMQLLEELPQQLVLSTHDLELAARCDEALIIHEHKILAQGKATEIIGLYQSWCATEFPKTEHPKQSQNNAG